MARRRRLHVAWTITGAGVTTGAVALALAGASAAPAVVPAALTLSPNHLTTSRVRAPHARSTAQAVGWQSTNWSGYAKTTTSKFTAVTGRWNVPQVSQTSSATYSATWVGIDGFSNSSLIQTGTEQDYYNGAAHYAVWWTTSSQNFAEQRISQPVSPGDPISANITSAGGGNWTITLSDTATQRTWTFTKTLAYSGPGASAEWIVEAPTVGGRQSAIANYSQISGPMLFNPGYKAASTATGQVSINNGLLVSPGLSFATDSGQLVARTGRRSYTATSTPSYPDGSTQSAFNMANGPGPVPQPS